MPAFPTTRWSRVAAAGGDGPEARAALGWLCERCWEPLRAHARRRGFRDDEDQVQAFYLAVLGGGVIAGADRGRGRFRTWLLACFDHHLGHARAARDARKRGGGIAFVPACADHPAAPADEAAYDRDWAVNLVARAGDLLAEAEAAAGRGARHAALRRFLAADGDAAAYAAAGAQLGLEPGAVRVAVHRLRQRFAAVIRELVAETMDRPTAADLDAEIDHLLAALHGGA